MRKNNFYIITLLISLTVTASCTRVVDLKLGNASGQLVIEGNFTNVSGSQSVVLTTNVPYSNSNIYPPVTGATVILNDQNGKTYAFAEGPQGTYSIDTLAGIAGNTYTLSVLTQGQVYTANSTLPSVVSLDSLSDRNRPLNTPKNGKDQKVITAYYQDPAGVNNQYRFVLWVNGVQVKDVFVYDDALTDGRYVSIDLLEQDIDIYPGDTATVEMQCIDKPIYTYWYTLQQQQPSPLGSVAPANPPTNISPAVLGYFSAHTTQTQKFIVK